VFSKYLHAIRAGGGPPSTNHGPFKASAGRLSFCAVHSVMQPKVYYRV